MSFGGPNAGDERTEPGAVKRTADRLLVWAPLAVGAALFAFAVSRVDLRELASMSRSVVFALPVVIAINGVSQVVRTLTWRWCLPPGVAIPFRRLLRIRLAAEAFSYTTFSGVAGDPLKVVLLRGEAPTAAVTASVLLERLSFAVVTLAMAGVWAGVALAITPFTRHWREVFFWFAFGAALVVLLVVAAVRGEGTYMSRLLEKLAQATGGLLGRHALGRFLVMIERHLLEFARTDRRRILRVIAGNVVNYLLMAAEVWVVLRAVGAATGFAGALTIETFTRVVGIASSPIPAGIGAMEASHVAVASALGLASAGGALALARRLRGLFWAGVGFAIYPRRLPLSAPQGPTLLYVVDDESVTVSPTAHVAGLPIAERVLRAAKRLGYARVIAWAPHTSDAIARIARQAGPHAPELSVATTPDEWKRQIESNAVTTAARCSVLGPGRLLSPPVAVGSADDLCVAERALRNSVFKPTDGVVARFNRRLSLPISLAIIRTPITPNQISIALVALGLYSAWLFSQGAYVASVAGAALSLAASILDGCDGEIARLKYQDSAFGCWLETIGDYSYYVAIFAGMTVGAVRQTGWPVFYNIGGIALAGSAISATLLIVLRQRMTGDRPELFAETSRAQFSSSQPGAVLLLRLSRCATRAVMPYGILILSVLWLTPLVVVLAAVGAHAYWIFLLLRFRQHLAPGTAVFPDTSEP